MLEFIFNKLGINITLSCSIMLSGLEYLPRPDEDMSSIIEVIDNCLQI